MTHGRHLKVLGRGASTLLADPEAVKHFLETLVGELGMRPLGDPVIHEVAIDIRKMNQEPFEDEGGVTGIIVLSTSHCAIHTWPARHYFVLDVYSCRDFVQGTVERILKESFGTFKLMVTDVSHALEYFDVVE